MPLPLYYPLNSAGGQIRVLDILPSVSSSAPIRCVLKYVWLKENPTFDALSYTWGRPTPTCTILLNGQKFEALENLEGALHRLRGKITVQTFWIDAICINQKDDNEKMGQIPLMGKIYAQAERVVVWLGEPEDGFRVAMKGIAANTLTSAYNAVRTLVADKYGHVRTYEEYNAAVEAGEIHG